MVRNLRGMEKRVPGRSGGLILEGAQRGVSEKMVTEVENER